MRVSEVIAEEKKQTHKVRSNGAHNTPTRSFLSHAQRWRWQTQAAYEDAGGPRRPRGG